MFKKFTPVLMLIVLLLAACAPAAAPMPSADGGVTFERAAVAPGAPIQQGGAEFAPVEQTAGQRIVITNVSMSLVVNDPPASLKTIGSLAEEMGGFVVSSRAFEIALESGVKVPSASITVRVPAERLDEALDRIRSESTREPLSENRDSQDVTREYTDLQSRLANMRAAEKQLQEIMDQAVTTEDVLNVYNQLVQVREQIEVTQGQIQYYEQSAALSAVSVELSVNEAVQPLTIGGWEPQGVAKDAVQTLINTLKGIANLVIWLLLYICPTLLVLGIIFGGPLWLLVRLARRLRKPAPRQAPPAPPP